MKNLVQNLDEVEKRILRSDDCVLMLDFDGTLSPIAETPSKSFLPESTQRLLKACSTRSPVAVISGRSLEDLKAKVGLEGLIYAGNHGLEWEIDGRVGQFSAPEGALETIQSAKRILTKLVPEFPGMLLEDKRLSLAIHYRLIRPIDLEDFMLKAIGAIVPILDKGFELIGGKKVAELRPKVDWNKGHFASFVVSHLKTDRDIRPLPIFVGDDTTDEDVFIQCPEAITVRVGKRACSSAKYYLESQGQVDRFLEWILAILKKNDPMPERNMGERLSFPF